MQCNVLKDLIGSLQQISPPSEHIVVSKPHRPWWERYQPVSYKLCSRSGTERELRDMITRCNDVGVKIYADVVINHMCMVDAGEGRRSTCGSYFNASREEFPSVPYSAADFNDDKCTSGSGNIENYQDIYQVRNCRLLGLLDLAQEKEQVRGKIVDHLNSLVDMGVAGFRVDACKHMWPEDLKVIYGRLHNLNSKWFPEGSRPLIYQEVRFPGSPCVPCVLIVQLPGIVTINRALLVSEVIDLGDEPIKASEYCPLGRVTEFKYGAMLGSVFRKWNEYKLSDLRSWGESWGLMPSDNALVFVDNHDNQRGHGAGGTSILTFWEPRLYKMAVAFMLAHPYGMTRVMSSYRWDRRVVKGQSFISGHRTLPYTTLPIGRWPTGRWPIGRWPIGRWPIGRWPTGRCPQDAAPRTLPPGRCPQDAAPRTLSRGRCPEDVAQRTLPKGLCPKDSAPQDAAHRTLPHRMLAHRTLPPGRCPQDAAPQDAAPQDAAHRTLPTGCCPQDAAPRDTAGWIVLDENDWVGPPSYPDGSTKPVPITPEGGCGDGWLEHPHTVPADGAVVVEVEGHRVFWTCDDTPFILVLTTVPPHTDSLGVSTKTKAGLVTEDDPLPF
ncbi:hypothetical protein NFI96_003665 [Prochilodus magdalenae]|nr:hypothetical protein NFI96_003665 [Prochilodus magdalenae]